MKFFSAKDAREMSETAAKGLTYSDMKAVLDQISKACEWGKTEIMIDGYIHFHLRDILVEKGYKISYGPQHDTPYTTIKW